METNYANPSIDFVLEIVQMLEYEDLQKIYQAVSQRLNEKTFIDIPPSNVKEEKKSYSIKNNLDDALSSLPLKDLMNNNNLQDLFTKVFSTGSTKKKSEKYDEEDDDEDEINVKIPLDNSVEPLKDLLSDPDALKNILKTLGDNSSSKSKSKSKLKLPHKKSKKETNNDDFLTALAPFMDDKTFASLPKLFTQFSKIMQSKSQGESLLEAIIPYFPSAFQKRVNSFKPFFKIPEILELIDIKSLKPLLNLFR